MLDYPHYSRPGQSAFTKLQISAPYFLHNRNLYSRSLLNSANYAKNFRDFCVQIPEVYIPICNAHLAYYTKWFPIRNIWIAYFQPLLFNIPPVAVDFIGGFPHTVLPALGIFLGQAVHVGPVGGTAVPQGLGGHAGDLLEQAGKILLSLRHIVPPQAARCHIAGKHMGGGDDFRKIQRIPHRENRAVLRLSLIHI